MTWPSRGRDARCLVSLDKLALAGLHFYSKQTAIFPLIRFLFSTSHVRGASPFFDLMRAANFDPGFFHIQLKRHFSLVSRNRILMFKFRFSHSRSDLIVYYCYYCWLFSVGGSRRKRRVDRYYTGKSCNIMYCSLENELYLVRGVYRERF